ncbi:high affinity sulfate permease [Mrakia frigida]|uniref:SLC26/SulP family anion transporter n=1 Tax=Mrakia frigida TaxID=29902 RepID=UPI003FCC19EF
MPSPSNSLVRLAKWTVGYKEDAPSTISSSVYIKELTQNPGEGAKEYVKSLFPFTKWIVNYKFGPIPSYLSPQAVSEAASLSLRSLQWAIGDLIAGITVGMVLVPQSMSYAKLAGLRPEFGLYSSFVGVMIYSLFATAKDVSIGPVAVMSLETGRIVADVLASHPGQWAPEVISTQLALICGLIVFAIGILRLGWLVEFIPTPAVAGFMTGSAISIVAGQVPALFGIASRFNTKDATYKVIIHTFQNLKFATLDAAFGVTALFSLYAMKWACTYAERKYPKYKRTAFFVSVTRNAFILIIFTIASWKITAHLPVKEYPISILKTVPSGFQHIGPVSFDTELIGAFAGKLPVATIILLLEHISIAKSFGRLNNYKIDPNQELIAIGVTNLVGTVFSAYPATGSFSRSALKSKSGVRTPLAGWPTGLCVVIALYALTDAFYFIPNAALSAIIIHAVADLVVSPRGSYAFWVASPLEFMIFFASVVVTIFTTIEIGIYLSLIASVLLLLFRIARPGGHFLGRVKVGVETQEEDGVTRSEREVYVPINASSSSLTNPQVKVEAPPAGVVIYRFEESFIYPNASYHNSALVDYVKKNTRRGKETGAIKLGDRPWNDCGPNRWSKKAIAKEKALAEGEAGQPPKELVRAVVLDFQAVANLDTTGVQNLVDTRKEIERWADSPVSFHFSGIISPWVQRGLIAGGFGTGERLSAPLTVATVVPQGPDLTESVQPGPRDNTNFDGISRLEGKDSGSVEEYGDSKRTSEESHDTALVSLATPYFHFDLEEAVRAAVKEAQNANKA